jgi:hypothetical protein
MKKTKKTITEQVIEALDGRTQRWLAFEVRIPEVELSKRMKNKVPFTQDELQRIEKRLNYKFEQ